MEHKLFKTKLYMGTVNDSYFFVSILFIKIILIILFFYYFFYFWSLYQNYYNKSIIEYKDPRSGKNSQTILY